MDKENNSEIKRNAKKHGPFVRFLKAVFVNNFTYKLFAIIFGSLLWLLTVGLGNGVF